MIINYLKNWNYMSNAVILLVYYFLSQSKYPKKLSTSKIISGVPIKRILNINVYQIFNL